MGEFGYPFEVMIDTIAMAKYCTPSNIPSVVAVSRDILSNLNNNNSITYDRLPDPVTCNRWISCCSNILSDIHISYETTFGTFSKDNNTMGRDDHHMMVSRLNLYQYLIVMQQPIIILKV